MRNRFTNSTSRSRRAHPRSRTLAVAMQSISPMPTSALKLVDVRDFTKPFESEQYS